MSGEQRRVFLWTAPRSVSTAFLRAFMNRSSTKALNEPYMAAFYFGPERGSSRFGDNPSHKECCFRDVKEELESPYPGYECVFVKDLAHFLGSRPHPLDDLPQGYVHTFLIRHPQKSVLSQYKMVSDKERAGCDGFDPKYVGIKELYNMYTLITSQLGHEAIVVDADDLIKNPETMLRMYCEKVGIDYQSSIIEWEKPKDLPGFCFQHFRPWFDRALATTSFECTEAKQAVEDLPELVRQTIDDNMEPYIKMHNTRLRPITLHHF